jgi:hypothetical protein
MEREPALRLLPAGRRRQLYGIVTHTLGRFVRRPREDLSREYLYTSLNRLRTVAPTERSENGTLSWTS